MSQGYCLPYHTVFARGEEKVEVVVYLGGEGKHARQYVILSPARSSDGMQ